MAQARLQITKDGVSGFMLLGIGKDHSWRLEAPIPWINGVQGTWFVGRNATKFRQFSFLELTNSAGKGVARLPDRTFKALDTFKGSLVENVWVFEVPGPDFDIQVQQAPPEKKGYKIRESWAGSLSALVGQVEVCGMEIMDPATNQTQSYKYRGIGLSIGPPIKKLPNVMPGASSAGPWNDFDAPGWMGLQDFSGDATLQTIFNVGLGTSQSRNVFDFAGNIEGRPGFLVHLDDFQTGRTFSLPSTGFSSGSMNLFLI